MTTMAETATGTTTMAGAMTMAGTTTGDAGTTTMAGRTGRDDDGHAGPRPRRYRDDRGRYRAP